MLEVFMKYSPKYFHDSLPKWKRRKDSLICRFTYRPISFVLSSLCANLNISANAVSCFSIIVAIVGPILFLFNNFVCAIVGAGLIVFWAILDCTDGNLARSYKKQPYGDFFDAISSYILIALMCLCVGIYTFNNGGLFVKPFTMWILILGALASTSDTIMRLIYQKFNSATRALVDKKIIEPIYDERTDNSKTGSLKTKIESAMGYFPVILLFATIFNFCDLFLVLCFVYYFGACLLSVTRLLLKAWKYRNISFKDSSDIDVE